MKILLLLTCFLILISCGRKKQQQPNNETPYALEEHKSKSVFSKRAPGDLLEDLYDGLVSGKPELQQLEKDIEELSERKKDSLVFFNDFDNKNDSYYSSAQNHTAQIQDSSLKKRMMQAIEDNRTDYDSKIAGIETLVKQLDQKQLTLTDHHTMLKLILTMAMMEKFQKINSLHQSLLDQ
jgi:hypothetical protein